MFPPRYAALQWNQHPTIISRAIESYWYDSPDVTFICEDSKIVGNKVVLSTYSPFLHSILKDFSADSITVLVPAIEEDHLQSLFSFLLTGEMTISYEDLAKVMAVDDIFGINCFSGLSNTFELTVQGLDDCHSEPTKPKQKPKHLLEKWIVASPKPSTNNSESAPQADQIEFYEQALWQTEALEVDETYAITNEMYSPDNYNGEYKENNNLGTNGAAVDYAKQIEELVTVKMVEVDGCWECLVCGKCWIQKCKCARHMQTHVRGLNLSCPLCGKMVKNKDSLASHRVKYH